MKRLTSLIALGCLSLSLEALAADPAAPGKVFKDCKDCPEMVVLPAGSYVMGTPDDELGKQDDEGPLHTVTFAKAFAMSRFHVTAGQWQAYAKETRTVLPDGDDRPGRLCKNGKPSYPQGPTQPAVCMTWDEARGYIAWLAKKTGKPYRMVSEAEREYAGRAGSTGPFPFPFDQEGEYQISKHANTYGPRDGFTYTAPVGSFPANAFGMYDMHGNVYEWVEDCWHTDYVGAPTDGSAWTTGGTCTHRQIRGNDYLEPPIFSRSGNRNEREPDVRGDWLGFRVARALQDGEPN
ncbi:formylglycine-generating enzyme family protein [Pseudomonas kurunegalensis]|uniref:dihydropyoverdine dehydrogenase n=1 Tax=Pseudomonas kurunegalensis TaxID=485880 RepID=UPI002364A5F2|nr:formylglycine-generating enzyme family protein [Pseudomonas kurunegalensis]MDD2134252.1 formylglycine-generating enzyme family protein [Pseudomonas kurunegalensis]